MGLLDLFENRTVGREDPVGMQLDRIKKVASLAGYASHEEFIVHVLEKELSHFEGAKSDADIVEKLKGLGYIS